MSPDSAIQPRPLVRPQQQDQNPHTSCNPTSHSTPTPASNPKSPPHHVLRNLTTPAPHHLPPTKTCPVPPTAASCKDSKWQPTSNSIHSAHARSGMFRRSNETGRRRPSTNRPRNRPNTGRTVGTSGSGHTSTSILPSSHQNIGLQEPKERGLAYCLLCTRTSAYRSQRSARARSPSSGCKCRSTD